MIAALGPLLLVEERKEDLEDVSVELIQGFAADRLQCCEVGKLVVVNV